jgi:2-(1,2-epoxy-1,2-dihydrophenyl)acetyl-CoA isomerase
MTSVLYEERGAVARVVLNRPERLNAMTFAMAGELLLALRRAGEPHVRAVLLTGAGRGFCSGTDLRENFGPDSPPSEITLRRDRHPALLALLALPKPVVCAVNGVAAGIGVGLALACDLVVASRGATFDLAFTRIGLGPDGGTSWLLVHAIGRARALRAMLLAEAIDGQTAEALGLVAACVPDDELATHAEALAARLADGPTLAYAAVKEAVGAAASSGYAGQLELEARLQGAMSRTADFTEGRTALLERRPPRFEGR